MDTLIFIRNRISRGASYLLNNFLGGIFRLGKIRYSKNSATHGIKAHVCCATAEINKTKYTMDPGIYYSLEANEDNTDSY